jgi:hypothetical protein
LIGRTDLPDCARLCQYPVDLMVPGGWREHIATMAVLPNPTPATAHDIPTWPARRPKPAQANAREAVISGVSLSTPGVLLVFTDCPGMHRDFGFVTSASTRGVARFPGGPNAYFLCPDVENATISRSGSGVITKRGGDHMED